MKSNFGIRFMLRSAMSFSLAIIWLVVLNKTYSTMDYGADVMLETSCIFTGLLILLGYYCGFNIILRTRVSPEVYLIYVLLGIILGFITSICGVFLFSVVDEAGYLPIRILTFSLAVPLFIAFFPSFILYTWEIIKEHPTYRRFLYGGGGSARWASVGTFRNLKGKLKQSMLGHWLDKAGIRTDGIYIGRSLIDDDPFRRHIVIQDDAHFMTIGTTGSGKGTTVLFPNLSMGEWSCIINDTKGELCRLTANRRHYKNIGGAGTTEKHLPTGRVYILDPFGVNKKHGYNSNFYSFLSEIDLNAPSAKQIISAISDGCFTPESAENKHFEETPKMIFEGFLVHVLSKYPRVNHTLPFVYDLIRGVNPNTGFVDLDYYQSVLLAMVKNDALGGVPQEGGRLLIEMGDRERGSMITTISRNLKWIGVPQMREHLSRSDFSFKDFGTKTTIVDGRKEEVIETLYIILPDQLMNEQMRWIRTVFSVSIRIMQDRVKMPKTPTMVIIDEFARLGGKIEVIADGFGILRSYGVKLWVFLQTKGQLVGDYPDKWSSMTGNSNVQVFGAGMGDTETCEWVSTTLGNKLIKQKERIPGFWGLFRKKVISETPRELLTPAEVTTKLGKSSNLQIIFPNDGLPMRLERLAFKPLQFGKRKFRSIGLGGLKKQIEQ